MRYKKKKHKKTDIGKCMGNMENIEFLCVVACEEEK